MNKWFTYLIKSKFDMFYKLITMLFIVVCLGFYFVRPFYYYVAIAFFIINVIYLFRTRISLNIYLAWSLIIGSYALLSILWAYSRHDELQYIGIFLQVLAWSNFLVQFASKNEDNFQFILFCMILGVFVMIIRTLFSEPFSQLITNRLGKSIGYNENLFGRITSMIVPLIFYFFAQNKSHKIKITLVVLALITMFVSLYSGSKMAFLIDINYFVFYSIINFTISRNIKTLFAIFGLGIVFLGGLYLLATPLHLQVFQRMSPMVQEVNEVNEQNATLKANDKTFISYDTSTRQYNIIGQNVGSTGNRFLRIKTALYLFTKHPLFGTGFESFDSMTNFDSYSHCNYTELLVSLGLIGTLFYYSLYLWIFLGGIVLYKKRKFSSAILVLCLLITQCLVQFASVPYYSEFFGMLTSVSIALILKEFPNSDNSFHLFPWKIKTKQIH